MIACRKCQTPTPEEEYYPSSLRIGDYQCKKCKKQGSKDWNKSNPGRHSQYSQKTRDYLRQKSNEFKTGKPCADCNRIFPPVCMDFDHVRGEKKNGVAEMVGGGGTWEKILKEIEKCDLVCACCHRIRTQNRLARLVSLGE